MYTFISLSAFVSVCAFLHKTGAAEIFKVASVMWDQRLCVCERDRERGKMEVEKDVEEEERTKRSREMGMIGGRKLVT